MISPTLTPRQRVLAALPHEEADRVPLALGGGPYGSVDDLYQRLVAHLGLGEPAAPFRTGHSISYMDDRESSTVAPGHFIEAAQKIGQDYRLLRCGEQFGL